MRSLITRLSERRHEQRADPIGRRVRVCPIARSPRIRRCCKNSYQTHVVGEIELNDGALAGLLRQKKNTFFKNGAIVESAQRCAVGDGKLQGRYWNNMLRKLGLRHRENHQTRHTYATIYIMNGAKGAHVAKQMDNLPEMVSGVDAKWIKGADKEASAIR